MVGVGVYEKVNSFQKDGEINHFETILIKYKRGKVVQFSPQGKI